MGPITLPDATHLVEHNLWPTKAMEQAVENARRGRPHELEPEEAASADPEPMPPVRRPLLRAHPPTRQRTNAGGWLRRISAAGLEELRASEFNVKLEWSRLAAARGDRAASEASLRATPEFETLFSVLLFCVALVCVCGWCGVFFVDV